MKTFLLSLLLAGAGLTVKAADPTWQTDLSKAQEQARKEHKTVLANFTGSDWCPWCIKLKNEVFAQPDFATYAAKNLVLVEIDFPRRKAQSAELKATNQALQKKYKIQGFPTVVVFNSQGKRLGDLGYTEGGPKAFLAKLNKLTQ